MAALGFDNIIVRWLVEDEDRRDKLLGTAAFLKAIAAILAIILIALSLDLTSADPTEKILIFIIAISVIFQSFNVIDFYTCIMHKLRCHLCKGREIFVTRPVADKQDIVFWAAILPFISQAC